MLPREAQDPIVTRQTGDTTALMYMSFNSKVMTASQITDYLTRVVQPRLQTIDGVANAQILGGQTFAMRIWLEPGQDGGARHHAARRAHGADREQLRHGGGAGEGRLRPDQHQRPDAARQPHRLRQAGGGDARRRAGAPRRHRRHRAGPRKRRFLLGVRRPEGGVHRRVRHADVQPAGRHRQGAQGLPGHPAPAAGGHGSGHRLRRDQVHRSVHQGGADDADRGRADRDRGDLPVPRQPALDHHSRRHHSAVADRRDVRSAGARLLDQSADACWRWCWPSAWWSTTPSWWWRTSTGISKRACSPTMRPSPGRGKSRCR